MKKTNENFENLSPEQQREIREESELYIEDDPRTEHLHKPMGQRKIGEMDKRLGERIINEDEKAQAETTALNIKKGCS